MICYSHWQKSEIGLWTCDASPSGPARMNWSRVGHRLPRPRPRPRPRSWPWPRPRPWPRAHTCRDQSLRLFRLRIYFRFRWVNGTRWVRPVKARKSASIDARGRQKQDPEWHIGVLFCDKMTIKIQRVQEWGTHGSCPQDCLMKREKITHTIRCTIRCMLIFMKFYYGVNVTENVIKIFNQNFMKFMYILPCFFSQHYVLCY